MDATTTNPLAELTGQTGDQLTELTGQVIELGLQYGIPLLQALVILIIGYWIINRLVGFLGRTMESRGVELTLARFLTSFANIGLKAMLLISVAQTVGIETTSFIAVLGAAGLAVGLALQGSLANFAGGVLILLFRPFKVGNWIEAAGVAGTVHEIQIFNTILKTPDNRVIIVPNGSVSNGTIINYSAEPERRVDFVFGVGYDADLRKVREVLEGVVAADERILKDRANQIVVSGLGDSAVDFTVRVWVNAADYWDVFFDTNERVKIALDDAGINIPFPQTDVHVYQHAS